MFETRNRYIEAKPSFLSPVQNGSHQKNEAEFAVGIYIKLIKWSLSGCPPKICCKPTSRNEKGRREVCWCSKADHKLAGFLFLGFFGIGVVSGCQSGFSQRKKKALSARSDRSI